MGVPQLYNGLPLLDSGFPAIHEDCCCVDGCTACAWCIDENSPNQVAVEFDPDNGDDGFDDITPPACDDDTPGSPLGGECDAALNGTAWVLDCADPNDDTWCIYGSTGAVQDAVDALCPGSGTTGSILSIGATWRHSGGAFNTAPSAWVTMQCQPGTTITWYFETGGESYDIDCTATWDLDEAGSFSSGTCDYYPCGVFSGPPLCRMTPVF